MEREKPVPDYSINIKFSRQIKSAFEALSKVGESCVEVYFHLLSSEHLEIVTKHKSFGITHKIRFKSSQN